MKFVKRVIFIIIFLTTIGILFRGWFYRRLVTYKSVGQRQNYLATDKKLVDFIEINFINKEDVDVKDVIKLGLSVTSTQLNFTASRNDNDPNKLINSRTAHCIGYASFFATTCNYLLKKYSLADTWTAKPQIGQLFLLESNVHKYFNSAFFKDHDFVVIENKVTGEMFTVDPTVNDYLHIDFVTYLK